MTNKPQKIRAIGAQPPKPSQLTEQERLAAIQRGYTQKYESIAQGVLFNLLNNASSFGSVVAEPEAVVRAAIAVTSAFMDQIGPAVDEGFDKLMKAANERKEEK